MAMLDSFPPIMPGEALYSVVAVQHLWSANLADLHTNDELFSRRLVKATIDLPNYLQPLADRIPSARGLTVERLADETTLLPYLTAFVPRDQAEDARRRLIAGDPDLHVMLGVNASVVSRPDELRYCAECHEPMMARAGRLWWRLDHQMAGVVVCPDHGCVLRKSPVDTRGEHSFLPATNSSCPAGGEPVIGPVSPATVSRLREIACRSRDLLSNDAWFESYSAITEHYRSALFDADMMITPLHLNVGKYLGAFKAFHGPVLAALEDSFGKVASPDAWILEMARKHVQAKHPLQHILMRMFLEAQPRRIAPFGDGPWACPNPVAEHGKSAMSIETVAEQKTSEGVIGTFQCGCGYTYTMSRLLDGKVRGPRYRCFGPLLDPALTKLVKDGATLRGAAAFLGIHPRAVATAAERLELGKAWKTPDKIGRRIGQAVAPARKERRVENPQPARRPSKPRVDWARKDEDTLAAARAIVDQIRSASPPVAVSLREIERIHHKVNCIYLRRSKLPKTMAFVSSVAETVEQFQERRLRTIIREMITSGEYVTPSMAIRRASLRSGAWTVRARELIAAV